MPQPQDVIHDTVDGEPLAVDALLRHHVAEHGLGLAIPHRQDSDGTLVALGLLLVDNLALVADERLVERHGGDLTRSSMVGAMTKLSASSFSAMSAPRPVRRVRDAVVQELAAGGHVWSGQRLRDVCFLLRFELIMNRFIHSNLHDSSTRLQRNLKPTPGRTMTTASITGHNRFWS